MKPDPKDPHNALGKLSLCADLLAQVADMLHQVLADNTFEQIVEAEEARTFNDIIDKENNT